MTEFSDPGVLDPSIDHSSDSICLQYLELSNADLDTINVTTKILDF